MNATGGLAKMTNKQLARWIAWRRLRFQVITHVGTALMEMLSGWLAREAESWIAFSEWATAAITAEQHIQDEKEAEEAEETSWKHNQTIAEVLTIALGGQDLRENK